ncbi:MAG: heavy metal translocating P-type ATPase [Clostridiales bacterium]|nr:heavy metal translocating P-type ATPase [Clostridiales bacterium]
MNVTAKRELSQSGGKTLYLLGLCCGDCARKIEAQVNRIDGVQTATLDFVSQKLIIEAIDKENLPSIVRQASQIARDIEPAIKISYTNKKIEEADSAIFRKYLYRFCLGIGTILFMAGIIFNFSSPVDLIIFMLSYLLVGGEVVFRALKNISKGQVFDENFLMSVATIGAFSIGQYPEGVAVMLFYQIGEAFQRLAVNRSRLMDIRPDFANLKSGGKIEGFSTLDTSTLTGESLPRDVEPGSQVLSGSINKNGVLTIEVSKEFGESTISKILELVQNASSKKAPTENFITKFARYYTPLITFSAIALAIIPPLIIPSADFSDWLYRALAFLVVSCPCALVISIPLSFFGGIGGASKNGILVKGSNYLEALNSIDTVVFDKTGTLTKGIFKVVKIKGMNGWSKDEVLAYAAHAESFSNHPITISIQKEYHQEILSQKLTNHEEIPGLGILVYIEDKAVLVGNGKLMKAKHIEWQPANEIGSIVYVAIDGIYAGYIVISDELKADSKKAIQDLKKFGVKHTAMLTGDRKSVGEAIAREIGLDAVYTELLPHEKVEKLEQIEKNKKTKGKLVFVGDGINDAPAKIVSAIQIARKTRGIVWQNILFAMGIKVVLLILAAFGMATMWEAVFGDVGVTIIAVLNSMRAMKTIKKI